MVTRSMLAATIVALALSTHMYAASAFAPAAAQLPSPSTPQRCSVQLRAAPQGVQGNLVAHEGGNQIFGRRSIVQGISAVGFGFVLSPQTAFADADDDRIKAGYDTLVDLIDNWGKYAGEGKEAVNGDNVRRQIGTVGNKSPLFNIRKVLLRKGLDIDLFESFEKEYAQIEYNAYSAIFADYSTSPKRGYQYIGDALDNTKNTLKIYKQIMKELDIKP